MYHTPQGIVYAAPTLRVPLTVELPIAKVQPITIATVPTCQQSNDSNISGVLSCVLRTLLVTVQYKCNIDALGRGFLMGFQYVGLLPSRASFYTSFLKDCGRDENLIAATCLSTVFRSKHGHAPCKIASLK